MPFFCERDGREYKWVKALRSAFWTSVFSLTGYGDGDPVNRIDPSGNRFIDWSIIYSVLTGPGAKAVMEGVIAYCGSIVLVKMQLYLLRAITGEEYKAEFGMLEFPCDAGDTVAMLTVRAHLPK